MTEAEYIQYETEIELDDEDEEVPADHETSLCMNCSGSGEGRYEGSTCYACKGKGEV